jgi:CheY-like chemotaxis protein
VKQILTFGRGVKGERVPTNFQEILREIRQLVRETFPKSIELEINAPEKLWPVVGDPTQLHQVLLNLAINARDAMPNGGKLTLTLENIVINPTNAGIHPTVQAGQHVLIQVTDTGTGMTKEILEQIFDPFFTTKPHGEGTGLGLSTSLGIIQSHGGQITAYSEPGLGSNFKIYLPASSAGGHTERFTVGEVDLPHGRNELILFVDDEAAICISVKDMLERHGYRVLTAANGKEAVTIYTAQGQEIAAVITDMHMPVMDGPAAILALRSLNPRVKVIGSSGLAADKNTNKAVSTSLRYFVPKPFSAEKLLSTLHSVIHGET